MFGMLIMHTPEAHVSKPNTKKATQNYKNLLQRGIESSTVPPKKSRITFFFDLLNKVVSCQYFSHFSENRI